MPRLVSGLHVLKGSSSFAEWKLFKEVWRHHPVASVVHQDPFTSWSYRKPRGYPGDAGLLDFIYHAPGSESEIAAATQVGRQIYEFTSQAAAPTAVRERRDILTGLVDRLAERCTGTFDVLAIASGHLREAETSCALREGKISRWVALDQDLKSIAHIGRHPSAPCVQPLHGSVRGLLAQHYTLGSFDFIYAAGLFDYLPAKVATRLTKIAFQMLKPGGTLLYANFSADIPDDGYMETFMDWHLLYRTRAEMEDIANVIPEREIDIRKSFTGKNGNIEYVQLTKA
jgi:SAM-dependent methyltransferase